MKLASANQEGFTLIELLFYVALLAVVLVVSTQFSLDVLLGRARLEAQQEVRQNIRFVLNRMTNEIRGAESLTVIDPHQLSLLQPGGDTVVFTLDGLAITYQLNAQAPQLMTGNRVEVRDLTFTDLSAPDTPGNVKINMTMGNVNPSNLPEYAVEEIVETTVSLR